MIFSSKCTIKRLAVGLDPSEPDGELTASPAELDLGSEARTRKGGGEMKGQVVRKGRRGREGTPHFCKQIATDHR